MSTDEVQLSDLERTNEALEGQDAEAVMAWAGRRFGDGLTILTSLQDGVLIDLAHRTGLRLNVTFLDTGYHFDETLSMLQTVEERYGIEVEVIPPVRAVLDDPPPGFCCSDDKVRQLERALHGRTAWVSGIRRVEGGRRAAARTVDIDRRGMVKINPLVEWRDEDVDAYVRMNHVPVNPLREQGYASIGCWPCTAKADGPASTRAGRWPGAFRDECGLHV